MLAKDILMLVGLVKQAGLPGRAARMAAGGGPAFRATQEIGEIPWKLRVPQRKAGPSQQPSEFLPNDQRALIQGAKPRPFVDPFGTNTPRLPQLPWWKRIMRQPPQRLAPQPW